MQKAEWARPSGLNGQKAKVYSGKEHLCKWTKRQACCRDVLCVNVYSAWFTVTKCYPRQPVPKSGYLSDSTHMQRYWMGKMQRFGMTRSIFMCEHRIKVVCCRDVQCPSVYSAVHSVAPTFAWTKEWAFCLNQRVEWKKCNGLLWQGTSMYVNTCESPRLA